MVERDSSRCVVGVFGRQRKQDFVGNAEVRIRKKQWLLRVIGTSGKIKCGMLGAMTGAASEVGHLDVVGKRGVLLPPKSWHCLTRRLFAPDPGVNVMRRSTGHPRKQSPFYFSDSCSS